MNEPRITSRAGWYADPKQPGMQRWWDGSQWTDAWQPIGPERDIFGFKKPPPRSFGEKVLRFIVALFLLPIVIIVVITVLSTIH